jgi:hypothetical protein
MTKFDSETNLLESDNKEIILTTHRIRQEIKTMGNLKIKSIMLEEISGCEYDKKSKFWLLIIGIAGIIIGIGIFLAAGGGGNVESGSGLIILLVGLISTISYFFTIKKGLLISSSSCYISMNVKGMSVENIISFIDRVEKAKNERMIYFSTLK